MEQIMPKRAAAIILSAFLAIPLAAEVYLLGGKSSSKSSALNAAGELSLKTLHTERVVIGNNDLALEVFSFNQDIVLLAEKLKLNEKSRIAVAKGMIRCRTELPEKFIEHLLFVGSGKGQQIVAFRLLLPPGFSGNRNWHRDLPDLPGGAKSELVLELPDRKAVFALFNNAFGNPQGNLRAVISNLSNDWQVTADESIMPESRGAMLIGKKNAVMLVGFSDDGSGFFYVKKSQ